MCGGFFMNTNPVIIIPGIGQSCLYAEDKNGNRIRRAWPVEMDEKTLMNELKGSLMKMMLFRVDGGFSDKIAKLVDDFTQPLAVNPDGSKKNIIKPVVYEKSFAEYTAAEKKTVCDMLPVDVIAKTVGAEKIFFFAYDFFGDIADTASELDRFVASVKAETGADKVDFIVYSTGGAVFKAYLKDFSVKCDCEKIINVAAMLDGASLAADIFENKYHLEDPAGLLSSLGGTAASVSSMAGMLPADVISNVLNKSVAVLRKNILDYCTSLWALVPDSRFDAVFESLNPASALASKVTALHDYSVGFGSQAKALAENGMKFFQICGYGKKLPPVVESYDICSDGIADTSSASFGGEFPQTTWYFRDQDHFGAFDNDVIVSLIGKILSGEIATNTDSADYPEKNGSRNTKKLRKTLIPKAKIALAEASGEKKAELQACIDEYEKILAETVIVNDENVRNLENRIKASI